MRPTTLLHLRIIAIIILLILLYYIIKGFIEDVRRRKRWE